MSKNKAKKYNTKVVVILGTTSSGKTSAAVRLAFALGGEIVSADSRQVYKGMDIGTGKDLPEYIIGRKQIPYHLIDVVSPKTVFNLANYQRRAFKAVDDILRRNRLPIIAGGSGLYLQALVDNYILPGKAPDKARRTELANLSAAVLLEKISRLKPDFASRLNNSERNNARHLARYLEIIEQGNSSGKRADSPYDFLIIGLDISDELMRERIEYRLLERLEKQGLVAEVKRLNDEGISWKRLQAFGLEYRFVSKHLLGELSYNDMVVKLSTAIYRFAKRQKTWFKRWEKQGGKIIWVKSYEEAEKRVGRFLSGKKL